jgi:hypothetical protein
MEVIDQIKQLPKRKPRNFGEQCHASELIFIHIQGKRVYGKEVPTYVPRTERGRKMATRWCMKRVPWAFTKLALKSEGLDRK